MLVRASSANDILLVHPDNPSAQLLKCSKARNAPTSLVCVHWAWQSFTKREKEMQGKIEDKKVSELALLWCDQRVLPNVVQLRHNG